MELQYPYLLGLLILPALLYYYWRHWRHRPALRLPVADVLAPSRLRRTGKLSVTDCLNLAAVVLLVIALGRPRFGDEEIMVRAPGIDIMLALDISQSMNQIDVPRQMSDREVANALKKSLLQNRLDTAKKELAKFIELRPNDRIGLIAFGEKPYLLAPPTLDHGLLLAQLAELDTDNLLGRATGLAAPVAAAVNRLKNSAAPRRVLVLFTDGANNVSDRITPQQAAELAKKFEVVIYAVGIGGARTLRQTMQGSWQYFPSDFDEPALQKLAKATDGGYFRAADGESLQKAMQEINLLEKTTAEAPKYVHYREYAPALAILALVLLLAGAIWEHTGDLRIP